MNQKELAIFKTINNEQTHFGNKVIFINNNSKITNVIFTGAGQKYYMMISWFNNNPEYNYLYLNPETCNYQDIDTLTKTISIFNSEKYNMIGISYGGYAAIIYSTIFPTSSVIITDPTRMNWNINITDYIIKIKSNIFYHRSLYIPDILEYTLIRDMLEKTNNFYMIRCSLSNVHSSNIPNEDIILCYIKFSEEMSNNKCQILMKDIKMTELGTEFLPWT